MITDEQLQQWRTLGDKPKDSTLDGALALLAVPALLDEVRQLRNDLIVADIQFDAVTEKLKTTIVERDEAREIARGYHEHCRDIGLRHWFGNKFIIEGWKP